MKIKYVVFTAALLFGSAVLSHSGVQNPAVMARMENMTEIAKNLKVIGTMAKGQVEFDAVAVREAAASIATSASATPEVFSVQEYDPKSEASPRIWEDFEDFASKASNLEALAQELSISISVPEDLRPAMVALGTNCKSCHSAYRQ